VSKIQINGEYFEFDRNHKPMAEMLALEEATGLAYGEWENGLDKGQARSLAALAWLVWKRDGRDVKFEDIISGAVEFNLGTLAIEPDEPPGPTVTTAEPPEASAMIGRGTSGRSAKSG
jgi:hypothetical protein